MKKENNSISREYLYYLMNDLGLLNLSELNNSDITFDEKSLNDINE